MRVIFLKDLRGQGHKDDIKEVKDGYAQNFLIKQGYAVAYTDGSMKRLEEEKTFKEKQDLEEIGRCTKIKEALENKKIVLKVKTGEKDRVFGSISSKQINAELEKLGYKIDKKKILLNDHLSSLGTYVVKIELHKKVIVELKVELVKE